MAGPAEVGPRQKVKARRRASAVANLNAGHTTVKIG
jgi:hypothetical protein